MKVPDADTQTALPCLWVLAGVLSYRLCDREYDCEGCDLFHALRGGHPPVDAAMPRPPGAAPHADPTTRYFLQWIAGCTLRLDRYYSAGHLWVDAGPGRHVALGLDGHALRVLHPVEEISPPRVGMWVKRGGTCGWIVRGRRGVPLVAPLAGEVVRVNDRFVQSISGADRAAAGETWLLRLEAHESPEDVPELARGEDALVRYLHDIRLIKHYLREVEQDRAATHLGPALADGGAPELDLERVLGPDRYEALVEEMFPGQI